ncbi:MAG: ParB/RepB/Spo0J family partition protein [Armatimonadota bacterium]
MASLSEKFSQHAQHAKGIGAALGSAAGTGAKAPAFPTMPMGDTRPILTEIPLSQIEPDPNQPRRDLGDLSELSASIRELGIIQPVIVSIIGYERYRIVAGERRFTAAGLAGLSKIPAIVRTAEEHQRLEIQLVENLHRKDLNPFEEAESYRRLIVEFNLTHEQLGKRLGKSQGSVTEILNILTLPEQIHKEARESEGAGGRMSKSLLQEIARRPSTDQLRLWDAAKRGELTVRKVRAEREAAAAKPTGSVPSPRLGRPAPYRHQIALPQKNASITIEFMDARPSQQDIIRALEEAFLIERSRTAAS